MERQESEGADGERVRGRWRDKRVRGQMERGEREAW